MEALVQTWRNKSGTVEEANTFKFLEKLKDGLIL
jgi:hypothetical protein